MGDITRNLYPYAIGRNTVEQVTLVNLSNVLKDDGSFTVTRETIPKKARVVALTQSEIIRLIEGGITINQGISVSLSEMVTKVPDQIVRNDGLVLKVVIHSIQEGCSVFITDAAPLAPNNDFVDPEPEEP